MANPYIGEIRMFGGNFAINGWAFCDGSLQAISQNDTLFNLIGTTYGGDGQQTFALPNLQSRVPVHQGTGFIIGQNGGAETVILNGNQIPSHTHAPACNTGAGNSAAPTGNYWAANANTGLPQYSSTTAGVVAMNAGGVGNAGGNQPHDNMIPFLTVTFIISLFGIFPSQN